VLSLVLVYLCMYPQRLITRRNLSILLLDGAITQRAHPEMLCLPEAETCEVSFQVVCLCSLPAQALGSFKQ